jgi:hypothetical protein
LIVPDEAHNLSSAADGKDTLALKALRAITGHERGEFTFIHRLADATPAGIAYNQAADRARAAEKELRAWDDINALRAAAKALKPAYDAEIEKFKAQWQTKIERAKSGAPGEQTKLVALSATPFAYHFSLDWAEGYLFNYGGSAHDAPSQAYNSGSYRDQFFMQHLGYRMRYNKLTQPGRDVNVGLLEQEFHQYLRREGSLSGRRLEVEHDYDRKFVQTPSEIGTKIDEAFEWLRAWASEKVDGSYSSGRQAVQAAITSQFDYHSRMYLLEALKAREAVPYIQKHLALGRKVVVFHDFNKGGGFHPFRLTEMGETGALGIPIEPETREQWNAALADFNAKRADLLALDFDGLKSPRAALAEAFGDKVRFFNGTETKNARAKGLTEFQADDGKPHTIVIQSDAGGAGISAHDTSGKHQRVLVHLGMPGKPTALIQHEGRIYRVGQASDAIFRYLSTGTNWERYTFAQRIAERASTAENFALGYEARGLKQSIIDAYQNAEPSEPALGEGKGGKALDRALSLQSGMSEFERAKTHYYAAGKKSGTRNQREGVDYFATPEPVGLKMVEWASLYPGESMLEPSAGHGAIARYTPFGVKLTAVEPSTGLASRLALVMPDSARLEQTTFEQLHVSNKFSGIVMNPPFGHGGATAVEHIAKAAEHLKDGGRIVALIPTGPAADKAFDNFLHGGSPAAINLYKLADIKLPPSTFQNASSSVMTRIVVLEKHVEGAPTGVMSKDIDLSDAEDIKALFDRIENISLRARPEVPHYAEDFRVEKRTNRYNETSFYAFPRSERAKAGTFDPRKNGKGYQGSIEGRPFIFNSEEDRANFLDYAMGTLDGDAGAKFSKGSAPSGWGSVEGGASRQATGSTVEEIRAVLQKQIGAGFNLHEAAGTVTIVATATDLPGDIGARHSGARGVYIDKLGKAFLVADSLTADTAKGVFMHEMGVHYGLRRMLGDAAYTSIERRMRALRAAGNPAVMAAYARIPEKTPGAHYHEEAIAYLVQNETDAKPGSVIGKLVADIVAAIKAFAFRTMGIGADSLTPADIHALALAAVRQTPSPTPIGPRRGPAAPALFSHGNNAQSAAGQYVPKDKLGLLDTPLRLVWDVTRAGKLWGAAFHLFERMGSAVVPEMVKAGIVDKYGLDQAVIDRRAEVQGNMIRGVHRAQSFLDRLQGLTLAESTMLYYAATNADPKQVADLVKNLPAESRATIDDIKKYLDDLGSEQVRLGNMDADTFERNRWAYLHREYAKWVDELKADKGATAARALRTKGDQYKMRGLAESYPLARFLATLPNNGVFGAAVKNGKLLPAIVGQKFIRLERRVKANASGALLPGGVPNPGRLAEIAWWPESEPIPAKFAAFDRADTWELRRIDKGNPVFWRDFTPEERQRMGEIEDIRYALTKTIHMATHDVEVGRYFEWLASNYGKPVTQVPKDALKKPSESMGQTFGKDSWVQVPDTKVQGTNAHVYGKLAGLAVPGPIWNDIRQIGKGSFYQSDIGQMYQKVLNVWKVSKTALSPAVHMNNVMANFVMADWHDINSRHLYKALAAMLSKGSASKSLLDEFEAHGGSVGMFQLSELQRDQLEPLLEGLKQQAMAAQDMNGLLNLGAFLDLMRQGQVAQAFKAIGASKSARLAALPPKLLMDLYAAEDTVFRLAAYLKAIEEGATPTQAGGFAREAFLDYDISAPWVRAAALDGAAVRELHVPDHPADLQRREGKPYKLLKLAMVAGAANALFASIAGGDDDESRKWLRDEKRGRNYMGVLKMIRMPWNDAHANPVYLDVRRFLPGGDVLDMNDASPLPSVVQPGGPLAIAFEIAFNKSLFTGKEIYKSTDTPAEKMAKLGGHLMQSAIPNLPLPGYPSYAGQTMLNAAKGKRDAAGNEPSVAQAFARGVGVKIGSESTILNKRVAKIEHDIKQRELSKEARATMYDRARGGLDSVGAHKQVDRIIEKKRELARELRDR